MMPISPIGYQTQPVQNRPWLRRLSRGFFILALMSLAQMMLAGLQVMVSDLSVLPLNVRMMLSGLPKYGAWVVGVPATVAYVVGYRLVTQYDPQLAGTARWLSRVVFVLVIWHGFAQLVLPFVWGLAYLYLDMFQSMARDESMMVYQINECAVRTIDVVTEALLAIAVVRVLRGQGLNRLAGEYWGVMAARIAVLTFDVMMIFWMHAAFVGHVDFGEAKRMMAVTAIATLVRMLTYVWMSVFFLRAWKAAGRVEYRTA